VASCCEHGEENGFHKKVRSFLTDLMTISFTKSLVHEVSQSLDRNYDLKIIATKYVIFGVLLLYVNICTFSIFVTDKSSTVSRIVQWFNLLMHFV
jgi:hypothetical protein